VSLLRVFFFFFLFFFQATCVVLLKLCEVEDFANLGTPVPKKSEHHLGLYQCQNEFGSAHTSEPLGRKPVVVNVVVVGPFEEGEEGTGAASDVVKVTVRIRPPQVP